MELTDEKTGYSIFSAVFSAVSVVSSAVDVVSISNRLSCSIGKGVKSYIPDRQYFIM
jgi:hypothetical protein